MQPQSLLLQTTTKHTPLSRGCAGVLCLLPAFSVCLIINQTSHSLSLFFPFSFSFSRCMTSDCSRRPSSCTLVVWQWCSRGCLWLALVSISADPSTGRTSDRFCCRWCVAFFNVDDYRSFVLVVVVVLLAKAIWPRQRQTRK